MECKLYWRCAASELIRPNMEIFFNMLCMLNEKKTSKAACYNLNFFSKIVFLLTDYWLKFLVFRLRLGLGFMSLRHSVSFFPFCCTESLKADQNPEMIRLCLSLSFVSWLFNDLIWKQEGYGGTKYVSKAEELEQKLVLGWVKFGFVEWLYKGESSTF